MTEPLRVLTSSGRTAAPQGACCDGLEQPKFAVSKFHAIYLNGRRKVTCQAAVRFVRRVGVPADAVTCGCPLGRRPCAVTRTPRATWPGSNCAGRRSGYAASNQEPDQKLKHLLVLRLTFVSGVACVLARRDGHRYSAWFVTSTKNTAVAGGHRLHSGDAESVFRDPMGQIAGRFGRTSTPADVRDLS